MALSFPANPSVNDTYSIGAKSWIWNGYSWDLLGAQTFTSSPNPPTAIKVGDRWYNTTTDTLYEYISDGASQFWLDISVNNASVGPSVTTPTTTSTENIINPLLLAGM
jgi:hypothetical protein